MHTFARELYGAIVCATYCCNNRCSDCAHLSQLQPQRYKVLSDMLWKTVITITWHFNSQSLQLLLGRLPHTVCLLHCSYTAIHNNNNTYTDTSKGQLVSATANIMYEYIRRVIHASIPAIWPDGHLIFHITLWLHRCRATDANRRHHHRGKYISSQNSSETVYRQASGHVHRVPKKLSSAISLLLP